MDIESRLKFLPWEEWQKHAMKRNQELTWDHNVRSPCGSIAKAKKLLGYQPTYGSLPAVQEAIEYYFRTEGIEQPTANNHERSLLILG